VISLESLLLRVNVGRATQLKRLVAGFLPGRPEFEPGSSHVGFFVDKVALRHVFSEYSGFPCTIFIPPISSQSPSLIIWSWYNRPVSGRSKAAS
jgi:hypothetical protein